MDDTEMSAEGYNATQAENGESNPATHPVARHVVAMCE